MQRYDPAAVEAKWQKVWDDAEAFITPNPEPGEDASRLQYVLEMLPYPSGDLHMGHVKNYTIGDALCHQRRRHGLRVLHPMGYDAFGLPAENAAIREGRPPARRHEREHRRDPQADEAHGLVDRLVARAVDRRARVLPLDAVDLPAAVRARARVQERGARQLVPGRPDGARQRAGHRRPLRALRSARREPRAGAVVLQDHRLRPAAAGRHGAARGLARARADDAAQLDRPLRGRRGAVPPARPGRVAPRLHDAARHAVRRDVLRAGARASADPAPGRRNGARGGGAGLRAPPRGPLRGGARAGQGEDRRRHRAHDHEPGDRRGDPDLGRRLRADGLRHRRGHGRAGARRARLRVRPQARAADRARDRARGRRAAGGRGLHRAHGRRGHDQLRAVHRPAGRRGLHRDRRARWPSAASATPRSTTGCATG